METENKTKNVITDQLPVCEESSLHKTYLTISLCTGGLSRQYPCICTYTLNRVYSETTRNNAGLTVTQCHFIRGTLTGSILMLYLLELYNVHASNADRSLPVSLDEDGWLRW